MLKDTKINMSPIIDQSVFQPRKVGNFTFLNVNVNLPQKSHSVEIVNCQLEK